MKTASVVAWLSRSSGSESHDGENTYDYLQSYKHQTHLQSTIMLNRVGSTEEEQEAMGGGDDEARLTSAWLEERERVHAGDFPTYAPRYEH